MSVTQPNDRPAILGGIPIRPEGPPDWPFENAAVAEAMQRAIAERIWGKYHGPYCAMLAERLAELLGCQDVLLCSSGTVAVELALRGARVQAGDEVVLAAYDFKGNFQNALAMGATPVLVDVDAGNWNLDPAQLEQALTPQTRAIIVSHLHGGVVPMDDVLRIARRRGIPVIEDACQMPGGTVGGTAAGASGDVGVISFGGSKLLTAGRGGALFSRDQATGSVQRARLYAQRGNDAYPLSELQAAILLPQLEQLAEANSLRARNVTLFTGLLQSQRGLTPFQNRPNADPLGTAQPGYYKLGLQYEPRAFVGLSRDLLAEALRAEGIAIDSGFRALHLIHSRRRFRQIGELPQATDADARALTLHHPILLGTADDMRQIVDALDKVKRHATMIQDASRGNESRGSE